jgi:hypothetical protein
MTLFPLSQTKIRNFPSIRNANYQDLVRISMHIGSQLDNIGYCYNNSVIHILWYLSKKTHPTISSFPTMDVIFEPLRGRPFSIEVGFFDSVLEIKEKIQKYQAIPITKQTAMSSTAKSSKAHTFSSLFLPNPIRLLLRLRTCRCPRKSSST